MTIGLAIPTPKGILLAADNGDSYVGEEGLRHTAEKLFLWQRHGVGLLHAGVAGRTAGQLGREIAGDLRAYEADLRLTGWTVSTHIKCLAEHLEQRWQSLLGPGKPDDKIEVLMAGYDGGQPTCAIIDLWAHCWRIRYDRAQPSFYSLGGRVQVVDEIVADLRISHPGSNLYEAQEFAEARVYDIVCK